MHTENDTHNHNLRVTHDNEEIWDIVWLNNDNATVDAFVNIVRNLYHRLSPRDTIRFLIRTEVARPPSLSYLLLVTSQIENEFAERPHTRTAVITPSRQLLLPVNTFTMVLTKRGLDDIRFFKAGELQEARVWLLK